MLASRPVFPPSLERAAAPSPSQAPLSRVTSAGQHLLARAAQAVREAASYRRWQRGRNLLVNVL